MPKPSERERFEGIGNEKLGGSAVMFSVNRLYQGGATDVVNTYC